MSTFVVRGTLGQFRPSLRIKLGESPEEAKLILLGTYRAYSWALWATIGQAVIGGVLAPNVPMPLRLVGATTGLFVLIFAHSLYWRLGYGPQRWILVIGHLSGLFALGECFYILRKELLLIAPEAERGVGG